MFTPTGGNACDINPATGTALTTCSNDPFHYERKNLGIDLQYRLSLQNKFSGGWDWADIERERHDFHKSEDNKVYLEWKNSSLEDLTARIKYQYLQRRSEFGFGSMPVNATTIFLVNVKPFDANDVDQNLVKLALDWSPQRALDLGAELIYKDNNYREVALGRTGDTRQELYLSAAYGDPKAFRVSAFFDYETTQYDSTHYSGAPNPATFPAPNGAGFQWNGTVKDENWVLGIAADWLPLARLRFRGSYIYQETDGMEFLRRTAMAAIGDGQLREVPALGCNLYGDFFPAGFIGGKGVQAVAHEI